MPQFKTTIGLGKVICFIQTGRTNAFGGAFRTKYRVTARTYMKAFRRYVLFAILTYHTAKSPLINIESFRLCPCKEKIYRFVFNCYLSVLPIVFVTKIASFFFKGSLSVLIVQDFKVCGYFFFSVGEIVFLVIAAFFWACAGNFRQFQTFIKGEKGIFERVFLRDSGKQKIKASAAAHRSEIDDVFFYVAVSYRGGKKMFYRMNGGIGNIVAAVGLLEPQIVGEDVVIDMSQIKTLCVDGVVDFE
jgi:hypothetical protein